MVPDRTQPCMTPSVRSLAAFEYWTRRPTWGGHSLGDLHAGEDELKGMQWLIMWVMINRIPVNKNN